MRLVIVSHTEHYQENGKISGWGPTVREINYLAGLFSEIVHIAPLHAGPAPSSSLAYKAENISLCHVPPSGGPNLINKLGILKILPSYIAIMLREFKKADVIHVRCPANISLIAIILLSL